MLLRHRVASAQSQAPYRSGNELQSATPHMFLNASIRKYPESPHLCGNQISGAPRHRRDVVPVAASARWRSG